MRQISQRFIEDLKSGVLAPFLEMVKVDDALCLEIRNDYINIYYRGGNLYKISETKRSGYKVEFDLNYCSKHRDVLADIDPFEVECWAKNASLMKSEMDGFLSKHPKLEREFQQLIERENNASSIAASSDYFIADIEYVANDRKSRFDMLAVKWRSQGTGIDRRDPRKASLSFIEVKYGDKALKGTAGVEEHVRDIVKYISDPKNKQQVTHEMTSLFNQKYELGLMGKNAPSKVDIQSDCPLEFILLIGNHNPYATVWEGELRKVFESEEYQTMLNLGCELKIAKASLLGYGLYDHPDCMISLGEYLERYCAQRV